MKIPPAIDASSDTSLSTSSEDTASGSSPLISQHPTKSSSRDRLDFDVPLYSGADLSILDSHILLYQYDLRHGLSKQGFEELIELVLVHLPLSTPTTSVHRLKTFFANHMSDFHSESHRYCKECHRLLGQTETQCPNGCNSDIDQFLHIPIAPQLKKRLEGMH